MMKRVLLFIVAFMAVLLTCLPAHAGDVRFGVSVGGGYGHGRGHYNQGRHNRGHHSRGHGYSAFSYRYSSPSYGYCNSGLSYRYQSYPTSYVYYSNSPRHTNYSTVYAPVESAAPRVIYGNPQQTYETKTVEYAAPVSRPLPTVRVTEDGWQLLSHGNHSDALVVFARQAGEQIRAGTPKVGYALASAGLGKFDQAVWAMRRAVHIDPKALENVLVGDALRAQINGLINRYVFPAGDVNKADAAFMVATMYWMLDDKAQAKTSIDHAIQAGDGSDAALNLMRMIERKAEK